MGYGLYVMLAVGNGNAVYDLSETNGAGMAQNRTTHNDQCDNEGENE